MAVPRREQSGFSIVELLIIIVVFVALIGAGLYVYRPTHQARVQTNGPNVLRLSSSKASENSHVTISSAGQAHQGWIEGVLATEQLSFYYPSGWTFSPIRDSDYVQIEQLENTSSGLTITFDSVKPDAPAASGGGSGGQASYGTTDGRGELDGKTVYYLDNKDSSTGELEGAELSSCSGAKKCLYVSPLTGDDIEAALSVSDDSAGYAASGEYSSTNPSYEQAIQILQSMRLE